MDSVELLFLCVLHAGFSRSSALSACMILLSVTANLGSVYLAYILVYVLHDICVVCVTVYAINFMVLICNVVMWRHLVDSSKLVDRVNGEKLRSNKLKFS